jgi:hypothetical protein
VIGDPWKIRCTWCGRARGFLPSSTVPDDIMPHVRDVVSRGATLPLIGAMICSPCDLDPARVGLPRQAHVLTVTEGPT